MGVILGMPAGRSATRRDPWGSRALSMLDKLGGWVAARGGAVADVYLVAGAPATLYVVAQSEVYDFGLSRELTEFAAPYLAKGVLRSATLVPACDAEELAAYFDPTAALRVSFE